MSSRTFSSPSYRYGFNGMEKDDEVKGQGNSYDFGARLLDVRLGKWLTLDPKLTNYPGSSPYNFGLNNPVVNIDNGGETPKVAIIMAYEAAPGDFEDHVKALQSEGYVIVRVNTGKELIDALDKHSSAKEPMEDLIILSHANEDKLRGSQSGTFNGQAKYVMDVGLLTESGLTGAATQTYEQDLKMDKDKLEEFRKTPDYQKGVENYKQQLRDNGARTDQDLKDAIKSGKVVLSDNMKEIMVAGCHTGENNPAKNIAGAIAKVTGKTVVAAQGSSGPTRPEGDSKASTLYRKSSWVKISPTGKVNAIGTGALNLVTHALFVPKAKPIEKDKKCTKHGDN